MKKIKKFEEFNFDELKDVYENLVCKVLGKPVFISKITKENDTIYAEVQEERGAFKSPLKELVQKIQPFTKDEVKKEKYYEIIDKVKDKFKNRQFVVYSELNNKEE